MDEHVYPAERVAQEQVEASGNPHHFPEILDELKKKARKIGLWNLFLPDVEHGAGLTNLEYAPLAEIMGRSAIASRVFNCAAPDTGNMEILAEFGDDRQKKKFLAAAARREDPLVLLDDRARGLERRSDRSCKRWPSATATPTC